MTDTATQLAQDVFHRIEREQKCQLHIIEDEIRCRLATGYAGDDEKAFAFRRALGALLALMSEAPDIIFSAPSRLYQKLAELRFAADNLKQP